MPAGWTASRALVVASAALFAACSATEEAVPPPLDEPVAALDETAAGELPDTEAPHIDPAPQFDAEALTRPPTGAWLTYGGTLASQRYSPLDQIDTENVSDLGAVWRTHLDSGVGDRYSGEATPIVYDGVIYISTGANDVFALDVATGEEIWSYRANLPDSINTLCCAWNNRGVAIGGGKLFMGRLDGKLVALDQQTGELVWEIQLGRWQEGETITAAPLYFDGMVISGLSGGEYGVRGRVMALDADTGEEVWRFYTIPAPGEPGHETWPAGAETWEHGGGVMWQTPSVDPELGLIYFTTSNPGPLFRGSDRAGKNLYANSFLALDVHTGEYRWHWQAVHHDLWDYDCASPVVLFDLEIDGEPRHALAEACKTGWVYILDRETGEPILPIPEVPVPQDEVQHTWPTQPMPTGDAFAPQHIAPEDVERLREQSTFIESWSYVNEGRIFTPPSDDGVIAKPSTLGGSNWPPSSYSPRTGYLYVCWSDSISIFSTSEVKFDPASIQTGQQFLGSAFAAPAGAKLLGGFTAMDMRTNTIAWEQEYTTSGDNCYSGSAATGGDLVFTGRNDGRLVAYDARDGTQLWEYQTGAGANAGPVTFEHEGTQYVLQYSAGNALAGSARGDIVTAFALGGDLPPLPQPAPGARGRPSERTGGSEAQEGAP